MGFTFEDLNKVNNGVKASDIGKGRKYVEVDERVKAFRQLCPEGAITTEIVSLEGDLVVIKATVFDEIGRVLATGTAFEDRQDKSSFVNKTSYIENCETSAVGRALGFLGLGIELGIASKEEVENAINAREKSKPQTEETKKMAEASAKEKVIAYITRKKMSDEKVQQICALYGVKELAELNEQQCLHYIASLEKNGKKIEE